MYDLPIVAQLRSCRHLNMPRSNVDLARKLLLTALNCLILTDTGRASAKCSRFSAHCCPGLSLSILEEHIKITCCLVLNPDSGADRCLIDLRWGQHRGPRYSRFAPVAPSWSTDQRPTLCDLRQSLYMHIYIYTPNLSFLRLGDGPSPSNPLQLDPSVNAHLMTSIEADVRADEVPRLAIFKELYVKSESWKDSLNMVNSRASHGDGCYLASTDHRKIVSRMIIKPKHWKEAFRLHVVVMCASPTEYFATHVKSAGPENWIGLCAATRGRR